LICTVVVVVVVVCTLVVVVGDPVVEVVNGGRAGKTGLGLPTLVVSPPEIVKSSCSVDDTGGTEESVTVSVTVNWPPSSGVPAMIPPGV
jgi:hypothetical protein